MNYKKLMITFILQSKKPILTFFILMITSLEAFNLPIFYKKLSEPAPEWMMKQIENDLKPFTNELSKKALDEFFASKHTSLFRIRVANGEMTIEKSESATTHGVPDAFIPHFYSLNNMVPLPDLDIIISGGDGIGSRPNGPALPIFTFVKWIGDQGTIFLPDWFALQGFEPEKSKVLKGNKNFPWKAKRDVLFFRGGDAGIRDNSSYSAWKKSPRPQLVALSIKYPRLIDAKFAIGLHSHQFLKDAKKDGYISEYVQMDKYVANKYLMDIDGNCAATPRLPLLLHSNCVILKSMTNSILWFYPCIKPYVHFIPVKEDLSDLLTQLQWAKDHPKACRQISKNARNLAKGVLNHEAVYEYLYRVLIEYSKKQSEQYYL